MQYKIGIDLGGTKIESAVLDSDNNILFRERIATQSHLGSEHILNQINIIYNMATDSIKNQPHTLGIGTPGSISKDTQLLKNSNTLCLNGLPLKINIEKKLNKKLSIENDANCFTLAEATLGAGKEYSCVFGVIMGTGCGGGFVFNKKLRTGPQYIAGEWGHSTIDLDGPNCYCKKNGCIETYISGSGLEKIISNELNTEISSYDFLNKDKFNIKEQQILNDFYRYFGLALSNVINIIDPDIVIVGGGLSNHNGLYENGKREIYKNIFSNVPTTPIIKNKLGDSAGVIGAAIIGI
ncbi:ROK family protein [Methylophilaceae bacterium]|nr:ROK family protein [Methylophilaceae bacterium]MDC1173179.1 ROK family protein [Methylophilaceae bacterium]